MCHQFAASSTWAARLLIVVRARARRGVAAMRALAIKRFVIEARARESASTIRETSVFSRAQFCD